MEKYNKFKLDNSVDKQRKVVDRNLDFMKKLRELDATKPDMVDDFQRPMTREVPVDNITKRENELQIKDEQEYMAKKAAARKAAVNELEYDAGAAKKEYLEKMKADKGKKFGTNAPAELNYSNWLKGKSKPKFSAAGLVGAGLTALGAAALPESVMAATPVQAGMRALDEGDPTSFLFPAEAGNTDEEAEMLAERNAQINYDNSPAHLARLEALKKLGR